MNQNLTDYTVMKLAHERAAVVCRLRTFSVHGTQYMIHYAPSQYMIAALVVLSPGQPLIDHGHFQYNNCSLGLTLAAVLALVSEHLCTGEQ